jgi:hypothetical protein
MIKRSYGYCGPICWQTEKSFDNLVTQKVKYQIADGFVTFVNGEEVILNLEESKMNENRFGPDMREIVKQVITQEPIYRVYKISRLVDISDYLEDPGEVDYDNFLIEYQSGWEACGQPTIELIKLVNNYLEKECITYSTNVKSARKI